MHMSYVVNKHLNNLYVLSNKAAGPGKKSKINKCRAYVYSGGQSIQKCVFQEWEIDNLLLYQTRHSTLFLLKLLQIKKYSPGAVLILCVSDCISALFPRSCVRSLVWATLNQEPKHMFSMAIQAQKKRSPELLAKALKISWLNAGKI